MKNWCPVSKIRNSGRYSQNTNNHTRTHSHMRTLTHTPWGFNPWKIDVMSQRPETQVDISKVSFAEYSLFYGALLQKRSMILRRFRRIAVMSMKNWCHVSKTRNSGGYSEGLFCKMWSLLWVSFAKGTYDFKENIVSFIGLFCKRDPMILRSFRRIDVMSMKNWCHVSKTRNSGGYSEDKRTHTHARTHVHTHTHIHTYI